MIWYKKEDLIIWSVFFIFGNIYIKFFLDPSILFIFKEDVDPNQLMIIFSLIMIMYLMWYLVKPKKFMAGKEKGTARWGNPKELKKIIDKKNPENNILFTETEKMSLNTRKTRKNNNGLIIGGSGSGKSRFFAKPNLMQCNTSFIVTDPSGELLRDTGNMLKEAGYEIKVFNLIDMKNSDYYNPFNYITTESDVLQLINNLIKNTGSGAGSSADPFWEKAETSLLQAIFFYILEVGLEHEKNLSMVMMLLQLIEVKEDDEDFMSTFDYLFMNLAEEQPSHIAVQHYKNFKKAAGKTTKSILIAASSRLAPFTISALTDLTSKDTIELNKIGDRKTALFIVIPDVDDTFNFMAAMLYSQMFNILYYTADFKGYIDDNGKHIKGRLKHHVRIIADEFANIGTIPNFDKLIATMRRREISVSIILQNLSQIKNLYKDNWESITGNCDSFLFLGGNEWETLKYVSEMLGTDTIDIRTSGKSMGRQGSSSLNYQRDGRELKKADELKNDMPDDECILFIRGFHPFYSKKIALEKHPNYSKLGNYDEKNIFDLQSYKNHINDKAKEKIKGNIKNLQEKSEKRNSANHKDNSEPGETTNPFLSINDANLQKEMLYQMFIQLENQYTGNPAFEKIKSEVLDLAKNNKLTPEKYKSILKSLETEVIGQPITDLTKGGHLQKEHADTAAQNETLGFKKSNAQDNNEESMIMLFFNALEQKYQHHNEFKLWRESFIREREAGAINTKEDFLVWAETLEKNIQNKDYLNESLKSNVVTELTYQVFMQLEKQYRGNKIFDEISKEAITLFKNGTYSHDKFLSLIDRLETDVIEEMIDRNIDLDEVI